MKMGIARTRPYMRRSPSIEALLPWLYLKGVSSNDFPDALKACPSRKPHPP